MSGAFSGPTDDIVASSTAVSVGDAGRGDRRRLKKPKFMLQGGCVGGREAKLGILAGEEDLLAVT